MKLHFFIIIFSTLSVATAQGMSGSGSDLSASGSSSGEVKILSTSGALRIKAIARTQSSEICKTLLDTEMRSMEALATKKASPRSPRISLRPRTVSLSGSPIEESAIRNELPL
jgi:2-methylaconitate cis-trans-isomerase PrpF